MRLAQGDMRKVLNILQVLQKLCPSLFWQLFFQSCNMAFGKVTEDNVYTCVGKNFLTSAVDNLITSIFFNFCLKWSYPHWVQGTPFAPISQTSQIGLLTKTSPQPTSNDSHITLYWSVLERRVKDWFVLLQPSEQAENSEGFEPAGHPGRGPPLRAQAWPARPGMCLALSESWSTLWPRWGSTCL